MTPPSSPSVTSPRFSVTRYKVRAGVEAVCSHWSLPPTRKPVSSRLRTGGLGHERTDLRRHARPFDRLLFSPRHEAGRTEPPRAEQVLHRLGETRSSGMSCCTFR